MSLDASRWAWMQRIPKNKYANASAIKIVLLAMADRADENHECYPSVKRLELDTELNRKTIQAALSFLRDAPMIEDTGRRVGDTGQVKVYRLLGVDSREQFSMNFAGEETNSANKPDIGSVKHDTPSNPAETKGSKQAQKRNSTKNGTVPNLPDNKPENGTHKEAQKRATEPTTLEPIINQPDSCAQRFDRFWQAYPKKRSKGQAEKTWNKIKPTEQLTSQMINAIERAKTSDEWLKNGGQFIPNPSTWLNAKGWDDELSYSNAQQFGAGGTHQGFDEAPGGWLDESTAAHASELFGAGC